jgi:hypothetical protein
MKPTTRAAMQQLIEQIKAAMPVESNEDDLCRDSENCNICALKLLEFMNMELDDWEQRLAGGETPNFGDLKKLANTAQKVRNALKKGGFVDVLRS